MTYKMSLTASDFGTFELSITQVENSAGSILLLVRNYRCPNVQVLQQLQQSWEFVRGCSHRHLGKVAEVRREGDRELLVCTEALQQSVEEWVQDYEGCPLNVDGTFKQIAGLTDVLAEAQRHQVLHRRLTPEHTYYDSNSELIKLLDFSPCSLSPEDDRRFVKGLPPRYSSPERNTPQWDCTLQNAAKADVYSLGILSLDLIYRGVAGEQTNAALLAGLREYQQLHNLLEQMLIEDYHKRPDFIRLQSYLRGEPEVPEEEAKVIVRIASRPPVSQSANEGQKSPDEKCLRCGGDFQQALEGNRRVCVTCDNMEKGRVESEAPQSDSNHPPPSQSKPIPLSSLQSRSEKEVNPLNMSKNQVKPQVLPANPISGVAIKLVAQRPAMRPCEKCGISYDFTPSPWRHRICARRSAEEIDEIYKYCSETCLPDAFKEPIQPNPSFPDGPVPAAPLQPAVASQASFRPAAPSPASQSAAASQVAPAKHTIAAPIAAPPPSIPVASEPFNPALVPARVSGNPNQVRGMPVGHAQDMQVANESMNQQIFCALCLRPFYAPIVLVEKYQEYARFCSEECQMKYFLALGDSSTVSKMLSKEAAEKCCMECSKLLASNAIVLPCSHKLCSRECGKKFLSRFFSNFPGGSRDLDSVTCHHCQQPISPAITSAWEREEAPPQSGSFPPPAIPDQLVPKAGSVPQMVACDVCRQVGPARCTSCAHWLCAICEGSSQKSRGGMKCLKCGKDTVVL